MTQRVAMLKVGEIIALVREAKGMSQRDLEKASGVSNALISQIETGKVKDPGFSTIIRLARALDLSINRLAAPFESYLDHMPKVLRQAEKR